MYTTNWYDTNMYGNNMYNTTMCGRSMMKTGLVQDLSRAVNGEYSAIACYEHLAKVAPNEDIRNQILEIREDEIRHYRMFAQIYASLTGYQPTPQITEECPEAYRAGLNFAFKDEQETVDFYLDLGQKFPDPQIKEQIRRAASDEQNHAVWFLYFLHLRQ